MNTEKIKAMSNADLIALYNKNTGKSIKKFSSRAAGEKQVIASMNGHAKPAGKAAKPAAKASIVRKVKGSAGANGAGRPKVNLDVKLTEKGGSTKLNPKSLRKQLIDWLGGLTNRGTDLHAISKKFERDMRGVVGKLRTSKWLTTHNHASA